MCRGKLIQQYDAITSMPIDERNVVHLTMECRRWKIENEGFNVLKNNDCHREHNFEHGHHGLSNGLLTLNLIAFAFHGVCKELCELW